MCVGVLGGVHVGCGCVKGVRSVRVWECAGVSVGGVCRGVAMYVCV